MLVLFKRVTAKLAFWFDPDASAREEEEAVAKLDAELKSAIARHVSTGKLESEPLAQNDDKVTHIRILPHPDSLSPTSTAAVVPMVPMSPTDAMISRSGSQEKLFSERQHPRQLPNGSSSPEDQLITDSNERVEEAQEQSRRATPPSQCRDGFALRVNHAIQQVHEHQFTSPADDTSSAISPSSQHIRLEERTTPLTIVDADGSEHIVATRTSPLEAPKRIILVQNESHSSSEEGSPRHQGDRSRTRTPISGVLPASPSAHNVENHPSNSPPVDTSTRSGRASPAASIHSAVGSRRSSVNTGSLTPTRGGRLLGPTSAIAAATSLLNAVSTVDSRRRRSKLYATDEALLEAIAQLHPIQGPGKVVSS